MSGHRALRFTTEGLKQRLASMERAITDLQRGGGVWRFDEEVSGAFAVIDVGDGGVVTGWTKRFHPFRAGRLDRVHATLTTAGTSDTVADVYVDDAVVGTVTVLAGQTKGTAGVMAAMGENSNWQQHVGVAGTGAVGLTFYGEVT